MCDWSSRKEGGERVDRKIFEGITAKNFSKPIKDLNPYIVVTQHDISRVVTPFQKKNRTKQVYLKCWKQDTGGKSFQQGKTHNLPRATIYRSQKQWVMSSNLWEKEKKEPCNPAFYSIINS